MDNIIESQIEIVKLLINLYLRFDDKFIIEQPDDDGISIFSTEKIITLFSYFFTFRIEKTQISDYEKTINDYNTMDLLEFVLIHGKNPIFKQHEYQSQENLEQIVSALQSIK